MKLTKKEFEKILKDKVVSECGVTLDVASAEQIYRCMAMIVRQIMSDRQKQFQAKTLGEGKKQVYYLCMGLYQNVDGCYDMKLFQSAKKYFDI